MGVINTIIKNRMAAKGSIDESSKGDNKSVEQLLIEVAGRDFPMELLLKTDKSVAKSAEKIVKDEKGSYDTDFFGNVVYPSLHEKFPEYFNDDFNNLLSRAGRPFTKNELKCVKENLEEISEDDDVFEADYSIDFIMDKYCDEMVDEVCKKKKVKSRDEESEDEYPSFVDEVAKAKAKAKAKTFARYSAAGVSSEEEEEDYSPRFSKGGPKAKTKGKLKGKAKTVPSGYGSTDEIYPIFEKSVKKVLGIKDEWVIEELLECLDDEKDSSSYAEDIAEKLSDGVGLSAADVAYVLTLASRKTVEHVVLKLLKK